ncbi:hypothetical protein A2U01_0094492, partial [Trifolium medium]|nr:hypothetical protein [Trifolium medium]
RIIFEFNVVSSSGYTYLQLLKVFRGSDRLQNKKSSELDIFRVHFFRT